MKNYASRFNGGKIRNILKISVPCVARYLKIFISLQYNIESADYGTDLTVTYQVLTFKI